MPSRVRLFVSLLATLVMCAEPSHADEQRVPAVDDLLNLKQANGTAVSPDGQWVAYSVSGADWQEDAFVSQLWLARVSTGETFQLTRGQKSSGGPQWSPDGRWIAFTSTRVGDKNQIFLIRPDGGEAVQATKTEGGVNDFAWSADGRSIAFTGPEPESQLQKDRKAHLGDFEVVREDYAFSQVWTFDVEDALKAPVAGRRRTTGHAFDARQPAWSPDGTRIAFSGTKTPDLVQGGTADIYVLTLADDRVTAVVTQPGPDGSPRWSPDGTSIAFSSAMGRKDYFHANGRVAVVPATGGTPRSITDPFDEDANLLAWGADGRIYFTAAQRTASHLFWVDPRRARIGRVSAPDELMAGGFSLSPDARHVAFTSASPTTINEVFVSVTEPFAPRQVTRMTDQVKGWRLGTRELISWTSKDGTPIEGVLIRPADFNPSTRYPLLVVVHGGPTGIDRPVLGDTRYYPSDIWVGRGALVLKVNYRGSAGYGEKFRQLNVRNLGVGDAWDVLSGVDTLVTKGWVDPARIACMGWSQGGYISAFLTTTSDRFAAISVGAGISDWATYYYNTDITPFTIQYLGDDPADDPDIYRKTSPMTYIKQAKTPTLIQHGEKDRRVPIPNAYELRQGLEDRGVPVRMVVYKGFGHGITKPKAARAVMEHNLAWFNHYLWGDPLPDFTTPSVPKPETSTR